METDTLYRMPEWFKLDLDFRADLVPLIEDVRISANIELWKLQRIKGQEHFLDQKRYLDTWLSSSGMKYRNHESDYYICWDKALLDKLWSGKIKSGEFINYPSCCIKNFEEGCQRYLSGQGKGPAKEFWQNAKSAIEEGNFDPVLYYVSHAPCSIECEDTLGLAARIKLALETKDPEAAKYRREYNQHLLKIFSD